MSYYTTSSDGLKIHYSDTGGKSTALVFAHGWLGNTTWWNEQEEHFKSRYRIVKIDLAGHGKSEGNRKEWTASAYADDIAAVVKEIDAEKVILIGHSMSGAYVLEASLSLPEVSGIIIVDTLLNIKELSTPEEADPEMFTYYRQDYKNAIENILPDYLFSETTPAEVRKRLQQQFLKHTADQAIYLLKPLYEMDIRAVARRAKVPVRAINSDRFPTYAEVNRKYLSDFDFVTISGAGHYPMIENPREFNRLMQQVLAQF